MDLQSELSRLFSENSWLFIKISSLATFKNKQMNWGRGETSESKWCILCLNSSMQFSAMIALHRNEWHLQIVQHKNEAGAQSRSQSATMASSVYFAFIIFAFVAETGEH